MAASHDDGDSEKAELFEGDPLTNGSLKLSEGRTSKIDDGSESSELPRSQALWILSASVSVLSTRYILITLNFHYPMLLLTWQLTATVFIILLHLFLRSESGSQPKSIDSPFNIRSFASMILASAALPVSYQAILHFPNIASLAMFSLHAVAISELIRLVVLNVLNQFRNGWGTPLSPKAVRVLILTVVSAIGSYVMFTKDYRLTSRGDRSLLVSAYMTAFAQAFVVFSKNRQGSSSVRFERFQLAVACAGLLLSISWYFPHEGPYSGLHQPSFGILCLNLVATAYAVSSGGSLIMPVFEPFEQVAEEHARFSNSVRQRILSCFSMTGVVGLSSLLLPNRGFLSALQLICYAISLLALLIGSATYTKFSLRGMFRNSGSNKWITMIAILSWAACIPINFSDYPFGRTLPGTHTRIDHNYSSANRFDIVVAHFTEDPRHIAQLVNRITSVPSIAPLNARLFVYTKNTNPRPKELRGELEAAFKALMNNRKRFWRTIGGIARYQDFPRMEVQALPNFGREGGTYHSHITKYYWSMGQHTLFTQSIVHDLDDMIARLDYFVPGPAIAPAEVTESSSNVLKAWWENFKEHPFPEPKVDPPAPRPVTGVSTGFLPLGFQTEVCDCLSCSDSWGWFDTSHLVSDIFKTAYKLGRGDCHKLLLVYKGQFIASSQRIRGLGRNPYVELRDGLMHEDRWEHSKEYLQNYTGHGGVAGHNSGPRWGEKDTQERPWFGYTMERMWAVLLQCSDMGVAWKCPTLKSRWRGSFRGDKADCQCLDKVRPPDSD